MSLKEQLVHEVETLDENDLQPVAEFVSFLKFRSHGEDEDAKFWQDTRSSSLDAIWNNAEDDVYGDQKHLLGG